MTDTKKKFKNQPSNLAKV